MSNKNKRIMLAELAELYIFCGYGIADIMGRPLAYFDFDQIKITIETLKEEKKQIDK